MRDIQAEIDKASSTHERLDIAVTSILQEIDRLRASNTELLKALKAFLNGDTSMSHMMVAYEDARFAVAKAEGKLG